MILPIELIIIVDQYLNNHNILILNKLINREITQSNNLEYWKFKYLESINKISITKYALDFDKYNSNIKYEYIRVIKYSQILQQFYYFLNWVRSFEDCTNAINMFVKHKDWKMEIKFYDFPLTINKFSNLKEFGRLVYKKTNSKKETETYYTNYRKQKLVFELLPIDKIIKASISNDK